MSCSLPDFYLVNGIVFMYDVYNPDYNNRDYKRQLKTKKGERYTMLAEGIKIYAESNYEELLQLLRDMCHIPAPSHQEQERAEFCKKWLEENGAEGVYIDQALNAVYPLNCEGSSEITVIAAHTDTVFPDTEPLPYREDEEMIYCPGVGDDTASVAVLLMAAKYCIQHGIKPAKGILFVCNSCEEGLGNLKGTRQLMQDYKGRIGRFITMDCNLNGMFRGCVGSHRYRVDVKTIGGHSYGNFGNPNAITVLAQMISRMYEIQVPKIDNSTTTYNVGVIEGGTSINTIAQSASMLCEYRSDNVECLDIMRKQFEDIFASCEGEGVQIAVELVGERPCAFNVDSVKEQALFEVCRDVIMEVTGKAVGYGAASTDCNIPLSLGIPAVGIGVYDGGGAHTREEWLRKESLKPGLEVAVGIALEMGRE